MKLKAIMGRLIPDEDKIKRGKYKTFYYENIYFLSEYGEFPDLKLGLEDGTKEFIGRSHFRNPEDSEGFYTIMFQIIDADIGEKYTIKYKAEETADEIELSYDDTHQVYFDKPEINKYKNSWEFSNSTNNAALGVIHNGTFFLNVYKDRESTSVERERYTVRILPSSLSLDEYGQMINDILNVRRELIIGKNSAKQSNQFKQEQGLTSIENALNQTAGPLIVINEQPQKKLEESYVKAPVRNIKKFNTKIIRHLILNQGSTNSLTTEIAESVDIYENRMIFSALMDLKRYLMKYKEDKKTEKQKKQDEVNEHVEKICNRILNESIQMDKPDNKSRLNEKIMNMAMKMDEVLKPLRSEISSDLGCQKTNKEEIVINIEAGKEFDYKVTFGKGQLKSFFKAKIIPISNNCYVKERNPDYSNEPFENIERDNQTKETEFNITAPDLSHHLHLWKRLKESKTVNVVAIQKKTINSRNREKIVLTQLKKINEMTVEEISQNELSTKHNDLYIDHGIIPLEDDLKDIESLENKIKSLKENEISDLLHYCDRLIKDLNHFTNLRIFKGMSYTSESWRLTQIFVNDNYYSSIWNHLRELDREYKFTEEFNAKDELLKKTDQLYEFWIFIAIIKHLIKRRWTIKEDKSLVSLIDEKLKKDQGKLEGISVCLKLEGNAKNENMKKLLKKNNISSIEKIEMKIDFNKNLKGKIPDYVFEITVTPGEKREITKKYFILDAKYRNYQDQGEYDFFKDLNHHAITKYYNGLDHEKAGSFLVHPDQDLRYTYFGGVVDELMNKRIVPLNGEENRFPKHKFGSFSLVPGHTENLSTFINMLLEYHFLDEDTAFICFECGSTDTTIEPKDKNVPDRSKYYITCNHCCDFKVLSHCKKGHKLIKHSKNNYHKQTSEHSPWYVNCPKCGD